MNLNLGHLRTIAAIHRHGGLAGAADALHLTPSALSHQLKAMEAQAGVPLVVRRVRPLRLTAAGLRLLAAAEVVLPAVARVEAEFRQVEAGRAGRLHIGMECPSCLDWLLPVLDRFRRAWPEVDLDVTRAGELDDLLAERVDMIVTTEAAAQAGVLFQPLFDYAPVLLVPAAHPLAAAGHAEPADLAGEVLLTLDLPRARIDAFAAFLDPAGVAPAGHRRVEQPGLIPMLVAAGRGIAVLPDWTLRAGPLPAELAVLRLGRGGTLRRLYAAVRAEDVDQPYMAHVLQLARREPLRLLR